VAVLVHLIRGAHPDQLVDRIAQLHLDVLSLARDPDVGLPEFAKKKQGMSSLLAQGQPERVLLTALFECLLHVSSDPVEPVCRTGPSNALVRPLVIVIGNPMGQPLAGIGKGSEKGIREELLPDRAPESLDLAQGHRVMGCTAHVFHPLPLEHLLKPALAPPGYELPTVVRQDLPRCTPLADGTSENFQHGFGCLLPKQPVADHVPGVIVDDTHQVHPVHPLELKGKDIDLP
jgi:hypothetical protein